MAVYAKVSTEHKDAFYDLSNAKKCADKNKGYSVFDESEKVVYTSKLSNAKSVDTLAWEVIQGKLENRTERKQKLTAAGYYYDAVQKRVNELMR